MKEIQKEIELHYIDYGNQDGKPILFLHGWGQNIQMMKPLGDAFAKEYRVIIFDLPGFGESEEPNKVWTLYDYVDCIHDFVVSHQIEKPILLGHSFGGKISLLYASKYEVEKVIVCGSPYRKEIQKPSMKTKILKTLKKVPGLNSFADMAKKHVGSTDYRNASPRMREILVEHVNLDITKEVKKIKASTLIIWGDKDEAVPLECAYELEKYIADAGVVLFPGCTHYAYLENLKKTINVVRIFIES